MSAMASIITGVSIVYSTVCSGADQRKHQKLRVTAFVKGIHRWPVNSPHKGPVTRNMFTFDDVIMIARRAMLYTILNMNYDKTFFRHVMKIYTHYSKEGHKLAKWLITDKNCYIWQS